MCRDVVLGNSGGRSPLAKSMEDFRGLSLPLNAIVGSYKNFSTLLKIYKLTSICAQITI